MHSLAVDIGGTKIAVGLCDENDVIVRQWTSPTPEEAELIDEHIANLYLEASKSFEDIVAIGISAAGNVKEDRRTISFAANISGWVNYPLADRIEALIDHKVPVVVENDANCAGWGEFVHGAGKGHKNMVALTVGTGLGGAIVIDGKLFRGSYGMAAEFGHLPMVSDGDTCGCGLRGCAERYTSGNALERFARSAIRRRPQDADRLLEMCGGDIAELRGKMVSRAADEGDAISLYAFNKIGVCYRRWRSCCWRYSSRSCALQLFSLLAGKRISPTSTNSSCNSWSGRWFDWCRELSIALLLRRI